MRRGSMHRRRQSERQKKSKPRRLLPPLQPAEKVRARLVAKRAI